MKKRLALLGVAVLIAVYVAAPAASPPVSPPSPAEPPLPATLSGQWSVLPTGPLTGRSDFVIQPLDGETVIWGGRSSDREPPPIEGAAIEPATGAWHVLPASGMGPRFAADSAWIGSEFLVWGGLDPHTNVPLADGAAFEPVAGSWRHIAKSPLSPAIWQTAYWTGRRWLVANREQAASDAWSVNVAAYDPTSDGWSTLPTINGPSEFTVALGGDDSEPLALVMPLDGPASLLASAEGEWTALPDPPFSGQDVGEHPVWTGRQLIASLAGSGAPAGVQGTPVIFDRADGRWRVGASPPRAAGSTDPIWTGRVLEYLAGSEPSVAYDPDFDTWSLVAAAGPQMPGLGVAVWASDRIIAWGGSQGDEIEPSPAGSQFVPDDPTFGTP